MAGEYPELSEVISPHISTSYSDWLILPGKVRKDATINKVDLTGRLTTELYIPLPFLSAAMQCVTGDRLAIALEEYGGLGVLPRSLSIEDQVNMARRVKRYKSGFVYDLITVSPNDRIGTLLELERRHGFSTYPVVREVRRGGKVRELKLLGVITEKSYHPEKDLDKPVRERMIPMGKGLVYAEEGISLDKANDKMCKAGIGVLPIIDGKGHLKSAVFYQDLKKHILHPNAFVDEDKSLMVFAAVSTFDDDYERAEELARADVNGLVIDTANAWTDFTPEAMEAYRKVKPAIKRYRKRGLPLIVGNVVTAEAFNELAEWEADAVKVGHGPGAGCTTRVRKRTGRGQATTVMECADARNKYYKAHGRYVPICADGGITDTGDMGVAIACGADTMMLGKYLCKFTESAAPLVRKRFIVSEPGMGPQEITIPVKLYWGEASPRAMNLARYGHRTEETFVVEGIEGSVFHAGSIHDSLPDDIKTLKSILSTGGCRNIEELHKSKWRLERQTQGSKTEGFPSIVVG